MTEPAALFISYVSRDRARAEVLHRRLADAGHSVWFDKDRLKLGDIWHKDIKAAADSARVILPVLTPAWRTSEWTRFETYAAPNVLPLIAEGEPDAVLTPPLRTPNWLHFDPLTADDAAWAGLLARIDEALARPPVTKPPFVVRLPHAHNEHFTGREADMNRLHEALYTAPAAALIQGQARAVTAMGGVGKTTLANEYVRRYWRLWPQILWVDASRGIPAEFAAIFDQMFPDPAFANWPDDRKAARILNVLREPDERLLVLDNAEDEESVADWIPHDGGCRTLITSRFTAFSPAIPTIAIDVLDADAARVLLVSRSGIPAEGKERAACDALALELGYLPLALEIAAAYIKADKQGFAAYLRLYEDNAAALMARRELGSTHYPDSVVTTWRTTMAKLSPEARAILRLSSVLGQAPIPLPLLIDNAARIAILGNTLPGPAPRRSLLSWLGGSRADRPVKAPPEPSRTEAEFAVRNAVGDQLHRYSMIQNWDGETFRVHALVREVEWWAMDTPSRRYAMDLAARVLTERPPPEPHDAETRAAADQFLAHGLGLRTRLVAEDRGWPDHRLPGLQRALAAARGDVRSAALWALDRYETARRQLGPIHPVTMAAAADVAQSRYAAGDYAGAADLCRVILEGHEAQDGPDHHQTLGSVNNLAACLSALGDAAGALPLYRRGLESCERVLGADHPQTLTSMNNLAECLRALGDAAGAVPLYRRGLESSERVLGADHPQTLTSVNNLALCLQALGDAAGALPLFRRGLESCERVLGADHPDTLISVNNLAGCLSALGDAAGALPLYRRGLESCERVLGADHPNTLNSVNNLARCLRLLGDAAGALPLFRREMESSERVLGSDHPQTLNSVNSLAVCLHALGDAAGALPLFRRGLESRERVLGADHPDTLISVSNLAECLRALGDAAGALPLARRGLESRERMLGADHPDTLGSVNNLAECLRALGDAAGALPLFRRGLESCERVLGADHPQTLTSVNNLAESLRSLGDAAGALPLYRRALEGGERLLGAEHPMTQIFRVNLDRAMRAADSESLIPPSRAYPTVDVGKTDPPAGVQVDGPRLAPAGRSPGAGPVSETPLTLCLALFADLQNGVLSTKPAGRLKAGLTDAGPEGIYPWDMGYVLDHVRDTLPAAHRDFVDALLAAMKDPSLALALDRFPAWRDALAPRPGQQPTNGPR